MIRFGGTGPPERTTTASIAAATRTSSPASRPSGPVIVSVTASAAATASHARPRPTRARSAWPAPGTTSDSAATASFISPLIPDAAPCCLTAA